jgi:DNA-binding FadR family transcriptional regulator
MLADSIRGPALYSRLQEHIKGYIVSQNLRPGDPLPSEGELASTLGVSRGSVREAIKALEALGVIEVQHGTGIFVRELNLDGILDVISYNLDFDPGTVAELLQVRKWLEVAVLGEIMRRIGDAQYDELAAILAEWREVSPGASWAHLDRRFHQVLNDTLGNRVLSLFLDAFWVAFANTNDEIIKSLPDRDATWRDHSRIVEAVRAGDLAEAQRTLVASYAHVDQRIARAMVRQTLAGGRLAGGTRPGRKR